MLHLEGLATQIASGFAREPRLLGEPEPSEDGKPRRLPQCDISLAKLLEGLTKQLLQLLMSHVQRRGWKLSGQWSHEMLLNFYTRPTRGTHAGPNLYLHKDLSALTLLLVPSHGGGKLLIERATSRTQRADCRAHVHALKDRGVLLVGTRFSEAFPKLARKATPHRVEYSTGGKVTRPRLSIAFFFCREQLSAREEKLRL